MAQHFFVIVPTTDPFQTFSNKRPLLQRTDDLSLDFSFARKAKGTKGKESRAARSLSSLIELDL
jgi:hypothetical protein